MECISGLDGRRCDASAMRVRRLGFQFPQPLTDSWSQVGVRLTEARDLLSRNPPSLPGQSRGEVKTRGDVKIHL
jgi:hypothetical protein